MCRSSSFPLQASVTRPVSRTRCPMTGSDLRFARDPVAGLETLATGLH
jgi:hypothetical protein